MARPRGSGIRAGLPACPDPGHEDRHVRLDGTYGKAGRKRQRYECVSDGGADTHVFTGPLARHRTTASTCDECENPVHKHQGPAAPTTYGYPVRVETFDLLGGRHAEAFSDERPTTLTEYRERGPAVQHRHCARSTAIARKRLRADRELLQEALARSIEHAEEREKQFDEAIATRDVVGQVKGILMTRCRADADAAFGVLREASPRNNRKLRDVARTVIDQQLLEN